MKWIAFLLVVALLVLHQDFWNFDKVEPLAFGFLPVGLWYHALYSVACALVMYLLVKYAWPTHLEAYEQLPADGRDDSAGH